jgi:hypothetical protein
VRYVLSDRQIVYTTQVPQPLHMRYEAQPLNANDTPLITPWGRNFPSSTKAAEQESAKLGIRKMFIDTCMRNHFLGIVSLRLCHGAFEAWRRGDEKAMSGTNLRTRVILDKTKEITDIGNCVPSSSQACYVTRSSRASQPLRNTRSGID